MTRLRRRFGLASLFALVAILLWPADAAAHRGHHAAHHGHEAATTEAAPQFFLGAVPRGDVPHCPRGKSPAQHAGCCAHQSCPAGAALAPMPLMLGGAAPVAPERRQAPSLHGLPARPGDHPPRR
jgi:hypothetical protein